MAATARRSFLLLTAAPLLADDRSEIHAVLGDMASALANGLAAPFLKRFDKKVEGYEELRQSIEGLVAAAEISASAEIRGMIAGKVQVDWYLQLKSRTDLKVVAQKRETLLFGFEKRGRNWIVTSLTPSDFFSYPQP